MATTPSSGQFEHSSVPAFRQFGALRRRRNELKYPEQPGDDSTTDEAAEVVDNADKIVVAAQALLARLGLFWILAPTAGDQTTTETRMFRAKGR